MTSDSLPSGWAQTRLEDVATIVLGQSPPGDTYNEDGDGLPFFQGKAEFGEMYPSVAKWCSRPVRVAEPEDVLISVRAPVGPTNLSREVSCIGRGLAAIRPSDGIPPRYLLYAIRASESELASKGTGSTFSAISGQQLHQHPIPLAPLPEQRRIVAEIEKQLTRLDAAVAALSRSQAKLKRYRSAVLKAACEGHLVPTEAELARAEARDYESADVLLERILKQRRARWEAAQLNKIRAKGKEPKDARWKAKYQEPGAPESEGLQGFPEGWTRVSLGQLTWSVKDGPHYSPPYVADGVPFITGGNVRPEGVDFEGAKNVSSTTHTELSRRCKPERGDILYTKGGTTGIARVNTYDVEFSVWVHVAVLKIAGDVDVFFLQHTLNSPACYAQAQRYTHGVGNQDLGLTRMVRIHFGLPPIGEQVRIAAEVDRRLSIVRELQSTVDHALARAGRLRQSILKTAVRGKLVAQDPNDEPANVLLERIRAERARWPSANGRSSRRSRSADAKAAQMRLEEAARE